MKSYIKANSNISLDEIYSYRQLCIEKKFIEKNPNFQKSENPIITVIMTIYNQAHCINKGLRSIQNQSIKNIEILIIDDCSTDNSTEIIKEFQKDDPRIILISHHMNEGKIKSRANGVRFAKGFYITIIDGDDALAHKDILKHAIYIAKKGNLDITEFEEAIFDKQKFRIVGNTYSMINLTNIIYQPELKTKFFIISDNEGIRAIQSRSICAKLVKNKVFKEAINFIGTKYTDDFILTYEDTIMAIGILKVAKSYFFLKELGYYYSRDEYAENFPKLKNKVCKLNPKKKGYLGHINLLNFLLDITKNNKFDRQLVYHELISIHHYSSLVEFTNDYISTFKVLDILIKSHYLCDRQKQTLITIKTKLKNKQKGIK